MDEPADLRERIGGLMLRDRRRLARQLDGGRPGRRTGRGGTSSPAGAGGPGSPGASTRLAEQVAAAEELVARRRASLPALTYPEQLPVSAARDEIAAAIAAHQVVVLAGETGSGKTTQLPKILLGLGRGITGTIGHTQPRRIAARAVAERVAEELGTPLGEVVGYTVRFHDQVGETTLVKLMTDGILLAELARDPDLLAYDTIVVDEAHERSVTIDVLLGYLRTLLPRRPDLKVVVTSATIDPERFAEHFAGAPVLTVSGRTFPVEVRYRPPGPDTDQPTAIVEACRELARAGPGDVLVFLSGEREIRDTAEVVRGALPDVEVVPLFGRLSAAEQHRVFAPHTGRRIVLATNVAETSLTVPGIRYVVDTGLARISRWSTRTKVQRLPIEPVSQASATQRSGRCGRVADGIAIRLYAEEDLAARPAFTEPEIGRTNLASVLLRMADLGLGEVEDFPFPTPPDPRGIADGRRLLTELGAVDGGRLTRTGRQLAQLPVDPRMGRMVLEAGRLGCVAEVLVIASALSVQDPRERPLEAQEQAAQLHARFAEPGSDLLAWLNLWRYVTEQQQALSSSAFRRLCRRELLSWLRIREWQDLHAQLRRLTRQLGLDPASSGDGDTVTQALLAGLLSHVGLRGEGREYLGARGVRFAIAPGSALARKPPTLVVAAELVETSRLLARGVARVEPAWVERAAGEQVRRTYAEPRWSARRGAVVADERVTLYGVPIVARRTVAYGQIDPVVSRDLFLRHALVEGDWRPHHAFWEHNRQVLDRAAELAARRRVPGVDDEAVLAFYDARVPAEVVSVAHFDRWWKNARHADPHLLDLSEADLLEPAEADAHPEVWTSEGVALPLTYAFEPGSDRDGVTVQVPVAQLARLRPEAWTVPALRLELVTALIRALPKALRVPLVPAPDTARALLPELGDGDLPTELSAAVRRREVVVDPAAWDLTAVPAHLRPTYQVVDESGRELGAGKDLAALQQRLAPAVAAAVAGAAAGLERPGLTSWSVGDLPAEVTVGGVVGYPTLVEETAAAALRVLPAPDPAAHHRGVRRLLALQAPAPVRQVAAGLPNRTKLALAAAPYPSVPALLEDCRLAAIDALTGAEEVRTAAAFAAQLAAVRAGLAERLTRCVRDLGAVLDADAALAGEVPHPAVAADLARWRAGLLHPGFVSELGADRLPDLVRWLRAGAVRAAARNPDRDAAHRLTVEAAEAAWAAAPAGPTRDAVRWMIEELRVSLWAPAVGARGPVSLPRIYRALDRAPAGG